jgi:hypothetical protein
MKQLNLFRNPLAAGLSLGVAGGIILILIENWMPNRLVESLPYVVFLILSVFTIRISTSDNKYMKLFLTGLITFLVMFVIVYLYLVLVLNPYGMQISFSRHFYTIAAMLGIGTIASALVTFLVTRRI